MQKRIHRWSLLTLLLLSGISMISGCQSGALRHLYSGEETLVIEEAGESQEATSQALSQTEPEESRVYVHVCGCVRNPGLYDFPMGARVDAAIQAAGGFSKKADQKSVNLAELLQDGSQIEVASKEAEVNQSQAGIPEENHKININTADQAELTQLNGVGQSRADAIISYRENHGRFASIDEILQVDGIGAGIYQKIKDTIAVE